MVDHLRVYIDLDAVLRGVKRGSIIFVKKDYNFSHAFPRGNKIILPYAHPPRLYRADGEIQLETGPIIEKGPNTGQRKFITGKSKAEKYLETLLDNNYIGINEDFLNMESKDEFKPRIDTLKAAFSDPKVR